MKRIKPQYFLILLLVAALAAAPFLIRHCGAGRDRRADAHARADAAAVHDGGHLVF